MKVGVQSCACSAGALDVHDMPRGGAGQHHPPQLPQLRPFQPAALALRQRFGQQGAGADNQQVHCQLGQPRFFVRAEVKTLQAPAGQQRFDSVIGRAGPRGKGARKTWIMMEHDIKAGEAKLVAACSYPLTGLACVSRIYTELAVLDITPLNVAVREMADGLEFAALQSRTGFQLLPPA